MSIKIKSFAPAASLVVSFLLAAVASYLIVMHLQHTVLQAWMSGQGTSSSYGETVDGSLAYAENEEAQGDFACGCPFCCSPPPIE